ncbi:uncharacterized protein LOC134250818, partial [Saccostrea cucullata]|uniref:uncharacterized protein LOC134250818 n=1 Tax=Saccostrea cuccullata TaxID=36930 RepID=UPI002ED508F9
MNTTHASTSLSKPSKMFENHTTETYSIINKYDTPGKTYSDLPLLYYIFKGGKIKAVVWQTLCCAFMFMMLLPSASGVPYKEYKGIQESAINVPVCPTTKEDVIKRAEIKHCQDFSNTFGEQLEYHCVLNDRGTGFVEVCSPVTKIIGEFCAEYNNGLGGIQPQKQRSCMGTCPFVYNSTDSYK